MRYLTAVPADATPLYAEAGEQDAWVVYATPARTVVAYAGHALGHAAAARPADHGDPTPAPLWAVMVVPVTIDADGLPADSLPYPEADAPLLPLAASLDVEADLCEYGV